MPGRDPPTHWATDSPATLKVFSSRGQCEGVIIVASDVYLTLLPMLSAPTTWRVPPEPVTQASQLIYLFNGMQPASTSPLLTILQPVLQWGGTDADEDGVTRVGPFWTVASWIVPDASGNVHHTPHVRVNTGDLLVGVGVMTLTSKAGGTVTD
jgi:hypothetical protein